MSPVKYSLSAIIFSAASALAVADEAPSLQTSGMKAMAVLGSNDTAVQNFYLEETVLSDRTTMRGRVMVDHVTGITCEWIEKGKSVPDENAVFHIVDRKPEGFKCISGVTVPDAWSQAEALDTTITGKFKLPKGTAQIIHEVSKISEISEEELFRSGEKLQPFSYSSRADILRSWDLATEKVCVKIADRPDASEGETFVHDAGCYDIKRENMQELMTMVGMVPA